MSELSRRELLLATGSSAIVATGGCLAPSRDDVESYRSVNAVEEWPMFLYDRMNRRCFAGDDISPDDTPTWITETDDDVWSSPVVADGILYIGSYDGHLYAIESDSGDVLWQYETGDRIDGTPAVSNGTVYVGSFDRNLYALDAKTGAERWIYGMDGIVRGSPTVADGVVYVGSHCRSEECSAYYDVEWPEIGYVYAFDAEEGDVRWRYSVGDGILGKPAVAADRVVIGSSDGNAYGLRADSGALEWTLETSGPVMASPTCDGDRVYIGNLRGELYALELEDGEQVWRYTIEDQAGDGTVAPSLITSSPTLCGDTVYVGTVATDAVEGADGVLYAISADEGRKRWDAGPFAEMIGSSPTMVDGVVYFGAHTLAPSDDYQPGLYGVNESGLTEWAFEVDGEVHRGFGSSPAVADGRLYIGGAAGEVFAFELASDRPENGN